MSFTITNKQKLPNSEFEVEGEINAETVAEFRAKALKSFNEEVKIDGFRPGHIPEKQLVDKLGEMAITEEAGRLALEHHYTEIITSLDIKAVGSPAFTITKVAPNEAFGFKVRTALMPEVKIGKYKKSASKIMAEKVEVTVNDKEVDEAVEELRKQVAHDEHHANNPDDHDHNHGELELPEVNEDFIKKFGDLKTVEEFKEKVKEGITADKTRKEKEKKRLKIMEEIIKESEIEMPEMLILSELEKMVAEMSSNISQMGLSIEDYLRHIGKTLEDIKKEWRPDAEKRAKTQLLLNKIAIEEKIEVSEDAIKKEVDALLNYYKDADRVRATIYVETIMLNEAVWKWLEEQK
jgi:FKBP-type peptidyl-prolyl cis-trans isomerase (trigger factor)